MGQFAFGTSQLLPLAAAFLLVLPIAQTMAQLGLVFQLVQVKIPIVLRNGHLLLFVIGAGVV